jgi:quercetin dioxygenase-like cupin family protein
MESINGAIIITADPGGPAADIERGPIILGPDQTADAYVAMIGVVPADDPGPPLHRHPTTDEGFYIAEGEITFQIGDQELVAGPGSFVFIPRGTVHTAHMSGSVPMRGMLLLSPGNAEHVVEVVDPDAYATASGEETT